MPKRSDREVFDGAFDKNPFERKSPFQIYSILQWGNTPKKTFRIQAPEPIVCLGELAALYTTDGDMEFDENKIFIAVGAHYNILYFIPINKPIKHIPPINIKHWKRGPRVRETHYYSDKGGDEAYYYHEHEKPFPTMWYRDNVAILVPSNNNGKRSYAVIKEGIVG